MLGVNLRIEEHSAQFKELKEAMFGHMAALEKDSKILFLIGDEAVKVFEL